MLLKQVQHGTEQASVLDWSDVDIGEKSDATTLVCEPMAVPGAITLEKGWYRIPALVVGEVFGTGIDRDSRCASGVVFSHKRNRWIELIRPVGSKREQLLVPAQELGDTGHHRHTIGRLQGERNELPAHR